MFTALKEYWFGLLLTAAGGVFLLFFSIVAAVPHDDAEMRGFTPCTSRMAYELATASKHSFGLVFSSVSGSYICYAAIILDGWRLWREEKQPHPWSNYFFENDSFNVPPELSEPISEDLHKANLLDEKETGEMLWQSSSSVHRESEQQ